MGSTPEIVDELVSVDGYKRWQLFRRADGLYSAGEDTLHRGASSAAEDRVGIYTHSEQHWAKGRVSGPFDTVEAAHHDALDNLNWFFEAVCADTDDK